MKSTLEYGPHVHTSGKKVLLKRDVIGQSMEDRLYYLYRNRKVFITLAEFQKDWKRPEPK